MKDKTEDDLATKLNEAKTILKYSTSYWDFLNKMDINNIPK